MLVDPLWIPACTGYPGADNNSDYNANYDSGDSYAHLRLIVKRKRSHEMFPEIISFVVNYKKSKALSREKIKKFDTNDIFSRES
jgi:hypothetical protein